MFDWERRRMDNSLRAAVAHAMISLCDEIESTTYNSEKQNQNVNALVRLSWVYASIGSKEARTEMKYD